MDFGSFSLHHFPPFLQRKGTDPGRVIQELDHFFAVHADSEIGDGQCPYHCKNALFVASPESRGHCQRGFCYNLLDCFRVFHYVDIRVEADIEISILENFKDLFHSLICLGRNNGVPPQCYENKSSFSNKNIFFCGMTTKKHLFVGLNLEKVCLETADLLHWNCHGEARVAFCAEKVSHI